MGGRDICWDDFVTADDDANTAEPCTDKGIVNEVRGKSDSEESDDDDEMLEPAPTSVPVAIDYIDSLRQLVYAKGLDEEHAAALNKLETTLISSALSKQTSSSLNIFLTVLCNKLLAGTCSRHISSLSPRSVANDSGGDDMYMIKDSDVFSTHMVHEQNGKDNTLLATYLHGAVINFEEQRYTQRSGVCIGSKVAPHLCEVYLAAVGKTIEEP
ncbi:hypothetical protein HPB50_021482 [Hyalomma asiaticum]|uniref:Uncharacterized protein n=1 Tax=Hyalomma asiaticum TaxID=266040 RepID=A0ACB7SHK7_HYAAI|nr:hypothetical protein HPB50_021482 [Hyalomma asiaticum]